MNAAPTAARFDTAGKEIYDLRKLGNPPLALRRVAECAPTWCRKLGTGHPDRRPRNAVKIRETPRYAELFQLIWHSLGEEFIKGRSP